MARLADFFDNLGNEGPVSPMCACGAEAIMELRGRPDLKCCRTCAGFLAAELVDLEACRRARVPYEGGYYPGRERRPQRLD